MKKGRMFLFLILVLCVSFNLFAQNQAGEAPAGSLVYAAGEGFQLIRDSNSEEYDLAVDNADNMDFYTGDYINTFDGTFLEIELSGSGHLLKISENTSFRFEPTKRKEERRFTISFGRIRARVEKLAGREQFLIDGPSMVAGVRGTDYGYDVLSIGAEEPSISFIYCFEGQVEVQPKVGLSSISGLEAAESAQLLETEEATLIIGAGEMVTLEGIAGTEETDFILEKGGITEEIETYWHANDFLAGTPIEVSPPQAVEVLQEVPKEAAGRPGKSQVRKGGLVFGGIGTLLGVTAATFAFADPLVSDMDPNTRDNLTMGFGISSGLFLSTSLMLLIGSLFSQ